MPAITKQYLDSLPEETILIRISIGIVMNVTIIRKKTAGTDGFITSNAPVPSNRARCNQTTLNVRND